MIKGVIFDMDGTLIDSMGSWSECDQRFLKENGIDPPPGISDVMKTLSMEECARYFIDLGVKMEPQKITDRIEELVMDEYATSIPLKPYVTETLDTLDRYGIPYCVATANYRTLTDTILKRFGIYDRFKFIYTCEENGIKMMHFTVSNRQKVRDFSRQPYLTAEMQTGRKLLKLLTLQQMICADLPNL